MAEEELGTGEETKAERVISHRLATIIHLFLSALAVLLLAAASIAAFDTLVRDFPTLWQQPQNEYAVLQKTLRVFC